VQDFVYNSLPVKVIFGSGTLNRVAGEMAARGVSRALVLSTPQQEDTARDLAAILGKLCAGVFFGAAMHTPVSVTEAAIAVLREVDADCLVALGGGSTTGLGKALALRTDLPQIVIPTSYAGSEATPILGQTEAGKKTTLRSEKVLPEVIIYDVTLTLGLPVALSVTSGMNAIAHAVEALYAVDGNPVTSLLAEQGIAAIARALPVIVKVPGNITARGEALFGAWACGTCLGTVGMALHHKLCHALGGSYDLPHAETHTVVLPHVMAFNAKAAPDAAARVARAIARANAATGLYDLPAALGAAMSLRELGLPESALDAVAEAATSSPYPNPRPVTTADVRNILQNAYDGRKPD